MKKNDLKLKLKNRELSIGSWISTGNSSVTEIMAQAGFEWLTIDMEHSAIDISQAQELIRIVELSGIAPLVRVSNNSPEVIKRVMDAGAHGVIVPMVNSKDEAEQAVKSVKYPTAGIRSVGLSRAQKYGFDFVGYKKWLEEGSIVIVQIEHIQAIKELEAILSTPGVDGSIIGPYDLSGSLGCPGEFDRPEVKAELLKYEEVCNRLNKPMGFHIVQPDPELANKYKLKGYTFLAVGLDTLYLGTKCREVLNEINK